MRKSLVILSILGMSGFLVACGNSVANPSKNVSGSKSTSDTVTITEMDYFTNSIPNQEMTQLIQQFEKSHPNIKIKRTAIPYPQLLPKSLQEAATHNLPTILATDNLNMPTMVAAGAMAPLDKFGSINTSQYLSGPIGTVTVNGKLYGLPLGNNDLALFYNKTMFKAAHLTPPPIRLINFCPVFGVGKGTIP